MTEMFMLNCTGKNPEKLGEATPNITKPESINIEWRSARDQITYLINLYKKLEASILLDHPELSTIIHELPTSKLAAVFTRLDRSPKNKSAIGLIRYNYPSSRSSDLVNPTDSQTSAVLALLSEINSKMSSLTPIELAGVTDTNDIKERKAELYKLTTEMGDKSRASVIMSYYHLI